MAWCFFKHKPGICFYTVVLTDLPILVIGFFNGLVLLALLLGSALISGTEAAFFSLSHHQIMQCKTSNKAQYNKVLQLAANPRQLLATILIINNLINVAFITLSTYLLWQIFMPHEVPGLVMLAYTLISTTVIVLFGEIIPKTYANQNNLQFAKRLAGFISITMAVLYPFSQILIYISKHFGHFFFRERHNLSIDQLNRAVEITTAKESSASEKTLLKGIVSFNTLTVKQIMQPRIEITAVDRTINFRQLIDLITESGYSRFPVYQETIDHVVGLLYTKDLLPYLEKDEHFAWQSLLRTCLFVPENKKLDTLLLEFQEGKVHIAIVVDEYGGTSGLITMEDVIEEIIGEIADEFDQDNEILYKQIDQQTFEFESKILLHDFCKIIGAKPTLFETIKGESESLGGLLLEIKGRLPLTGEKIVYKQFTFTVLAADTRKTTKIKVTINPLPIKETDIS